jgi:hypothetical protein
MLLFGNYNYPEVVHVVQARITMADFPGSGRPKLRNWSQNARCKLNERLWLKPTGAKPNA